ncbi:hypothetical protein [Nocardioides zeae]
MVGVEGEHEGAQVVEQPLGGGGTTGRADPTTPAPTKTASAATAATSVSCRRIASATSAATAPHWIAAAWSRTAPARSLLRRARASTERSSRTKQ